MARRKRYAPLPRTKATTPFGILKDVAKAIRAEPKRYFQGDWVRAVRGSTHYVGPNLGTVDDSLMIPQSRADAPACGTVGCVAGWVRILTRKRGESRAWFLALENDNSGDRYMDEVVSEGARLALNLTKRQAKILFYANPPQFAREVDKGSLRVGTAEYAEAGIRHIERFMRRNMGYKGPKL